MTSSTRKSAAKPKSDYSIQTVTNALRLLEAFDHEDELGVAELSRTLALHKNNVFRLLATLEQAGYIEQNLETGASTGSAWRCLELGQRYVRGRADVVVRARATALAELVALGGGNRPSSDCCGTTRSLHLAGEQPRQQVAPDRAARRRATARALHRARQGAARRTPSRRFARTYDRRYLADGARSGAAGRGDDRRPRTSCSST